MAEEDEVDIEGDFDFKITSDDETSNIYDLNEPPSKTANLQPEFSQHPWMLEQGWSLDQVTDEKSKAVIEKMLLEEQHYNNYKTRRKPPNVVQSKPKAKQPPTKKFWSEEEKQQFLKGFLKWGRRWAKIAELIPGRTVQQVKNYGQQYLKTTDKKKGLIDLPGLTDLPASSLPHSLESSIALVTTAHPTVPVRPSSGSRQAKQSLLVSTSEVVRIKAVDQMDSEEEEEVDIEDSGDDVQSCDADENHIYRSLIAAAGISATTPHASESYVIDEPEKNDETQDIKSEPAFEEVADADDKYERSLSPNENSQSIEHFYESHSLPNTDDDEGSSADEFPELENESWIMTSNGEMKALPNPTEERILKRDEVLDEEQQIHSEFFDGRSSSKNSDRYLKIRNHILDHWTKSKPGYVNKTVVRVGLKNCGDVNCIGRIHAYLEQIGAINFGCEQCQYNRPVKPSKPRRKFHMSAIPVVRDNDITPRKRRVRAVDGSWIDEKDLQGKTIEHREFSNRIPKRVKLKHSKDPFKLLPCQGFSEMHPKPFDVVIEASVLVLLDVHAHQCRTEVIGMLGGKYLDDERKLLITMALPCESLSTHLQCEMDPVSQSHSCMHIMSKGQSVVGWYHSHPTFRPDPSIRDMETQAKYQAWFAQGGNPFLGVIISPYNSTGSSPSLHSQVRCLAASKVSLEDDADDYAGDPFRFDFEVGSEFWDSETVLEEVKAVVQKYVSYSSRVNLLNRYHHNSTVTCLEKLLASIQRVVPLFDEDRDSFMAQMSEVIEDYYNAANINISVMDNLNYVPEELTEDEIFSEEQKFSEDIPIFKDNQKPDVSDNNESCIENDGLSVNQCEEMFETRMQTANSESSRDNLLSKNS